jgi:hypothetical protein
MSLSVSELDHFREHGYLVKPDVFRDADMEPIRDAIGEIISDAADQLQRDGELEQTFPAASFEDRLAQLYRHDKNAAKKVYGAIMGNNGGGGGYSGAAMFDMVRHPPLLSCIQSIIGDEIVGSSVYRIRPKLPGDSHGEVPWHQDSGYTLSHCDTYMVVTCWIPLVDVSIQNGCLYIIPDSHQEGVYTHYTGGHGGFLEIMKRDIPNIENAIPIEMAAGGVLFLTNVTPHASFDNATDKVRWSIDLRYQNATTPNNVGELPEDYTPEREQVTMACYPGEADFVLQSPSHPDRVVSDADEFHRLREIYVNGHVHSPGRNWTPLTERTAAEQ